MKISAIIAEYNPLHHGHAWHIAQTKARTHADAIIAIISGNFTQRGEPAIFDKWQRTRYALQAGIDAVFELPVFYATSSAQAFAFGAISLLNQCHCIDFLSFGAETDDLPLLAQIAEIAANEPALYQQELKAQLAKGLSFAKARAIALSQCCNSKEYLSILNGANNILAISYLEALQKLHSPMQPILIERKGAPYGERALSGAFSSALSIRSAIKRKDLAFQKALPNGHALPLESAVFPEAMFPALAYLLRKSTKEELQQIYGMAEGLEQRFLQAATSSQTYADFLSNIKSKRYPETHIKRLLCRIFLGVTNELAQTIQQDPFYLRLLGIRKEKKDLLSYLQKHAGIPFIVRPAEYAFSGLLLDTLASDLYGTLSRPIQPSKRDYTEKLIVL